MMEADWFKGRAFELGVPVTPSTLTERAASSRGDFHRALVGSHRRQAVQLRANEQRLLAAGIARRLSAPGAQRSLLQRPPIAERQRPRQRTRGIHQAQMRSRLHRTLTSRQERDAGDGGGYLTPQRAHRGLRDLLGAGL